MCLVYKIFLVCYLCLVVFPDFAIMLGVMSIFVRYTDPNKRSIPLYMRSDLRCRGSSVLGRPSTKAAVRCLVILSLVQR